jgi:hypothetical protein
MGGLPFQILNIDSRSRGIYESISRTDATS